MVQGTDIKMIAADLGPKAHSYEIAIKGETDDFTLTAYDDNGDLNIDTITYTGGAVSKAPPPKTLLQPVTAYIKKFHQTDLPRELSDVLKKLSAVQKERTVEGVCGKDNKIQPTASFRKIIPALKKGDFFATALSLGISGGTYILRFRSSSGVQISIDRTEAGEVFDSSVNKKRVCTNIPDTVLEGTKRYLLLTNSIWLPSIWLP